MNIINKLVNLKWFQYLIQKFSANLFYTVMSCSNFMLATILRINRHIYICIHLSLCQFFMIYQSAFGMLNYLF